MNNKKPVKGQQLASLNKGTKPKLGILPVEFDLYVEAPVEKVTEKKAVPKKAPAKKSKAKKSEVKKDGSTEKTI
tara:strand:- start:9771 stop:9992 length:222 start_codon:yes stop_codon:yes gene_type:complete